jgi:calcineurin-like phosphoesterase
MIGDIVGQIGQQTLKTYLSELKQTYLPDLIVVNGENAAPNGRGITQDIYRIRSRLCDDGQSHMGTIGNFRFY